MRTQVGKALLMHHCKNYKRTNLTGYWKFNHFLYVALNLSRAVIIFDPFYRATLPINMAEPTRRPSLVPLLATYCNYFARDKAETYYAAILQPYKINTAYASAAATTTSAEVARPIYTADQEVFPTAFLQ